MYQGLLNTFCTVILGKTCSNRLNLPLTGLDLDSPTASANCNGEIAHKKHFLPQVDKRITKGLTTCIVTFYSFNMGKWRINMNVSSSHELTEVLPSPIGFDKQIVGVVS